jgi:hypothetical protein
MAKVFICILQVERYFMENYKLIILSNIPRTPKSSEYLPY